MLLAIDAQLRGVEQMADAVRDGAVAVLQFGAHVGERALGLDAGDALVHAQALVLFGDVALVDAQADAEVELRGQVCSACSLRP